MILHSSLFTFLVSVAVARYFTTASGVTTRVATRVAAGVVARVVASGVGRSRGLVIDLFPKRIKDLSP